VGEVETPAAPKKEKKRERRLRTYVVFKKVSEKTYEVVGEFSGVRNLKHLIRRVRAGEIKIAPGDYVAVTKKALLSIPAIAFQPPKVRKKKE